MHGNEPAGSLALERVVASLQNDPARLVRGDFLALSGNLIALSENQRYIERDLNRQWHGDGLALLDDAPAGLDKERQEQKAILGELERAFARSRGSVALVDLHTTSGPGVPFAVFADTLRSRGFARRFPIPVVLGLEETLVGTLVDFVGGLGHMAVGFEGEQHLDPESIERLESVVWIALAELGMVPRRQPEVVRARGALREVARGLPDVLEVRHRHAVAAGDGFGMHPGFRGFQPVEKGLVVASDANGEIRVPRSGYLLMPLYQKQGDDGFFVVSRVREAWLSISATLRYLRAGRIVHWLPGVRKDPDDPELLLVDLRVAKWFALQLMHLLGFRRRERRGGILVVQRRRHDLA